MPDYKVLSVEEAIPLLLDRTVSPVVAFDTEFDPETGALHGMSAAGGTPTTGFFGCFWSFEKGYQQQPWSVVFQRVIAPIFGDPQREVTMHPINVDIQKFRARGLTDEMTLCKLTDTVAMAYIYDDNLPHSLKDLAYCILLQTDTKSYKATQQEIEGIKKKAKPLIREELKLIWECYKEHRKKSDELEVQVDPSWPGWRRLAMSLPPGMNKITSKKTGKKGIMEIVEPMVSAVIQADFDRQAHEQFALYGAKDAIYTLMLRYFFMPTFTPLQLDHLELETYITHPCVTEMEERGLKINIPLLEDIATAMRVSLEALRADVLSRWSTPNDEAPFNPASGDQVAKRMWLEWKLTPPAWAKDRRGGIKNKHRRNKDGLCATDALIMEAMADKYADTQYGPAIQGLLDLRRWEKLMGTYVEPILRKAKSDPDGRIHSSFWPTGARSGRFSSSDPNVENIPRPFTMPTITMEQARTIYGDEIDPFNPPRGFVANIKKNKDAQGPCADRSHKGCPQCAVVKSWRVNSLREIFIPPPGYLYVSADLSQIENRIAAFESRDQNMLKLYRQWDCFECKSTGESNVILHKCPVCGAKEGKRDKNHPDQPVIKGFVHGRDIHSATAAYLGFFEKYGADGRQQAKPVNHGATYAMGAQTFAKKEGVPVKDATDRLERWHRTYPAVRGALEQAQPGTLHYRVAEAIREVGQVEMFDRHLRRFHAQQLLMMSGNFRPWEWEGTIREGVNVKMQGGTGIGMKRAMKKIRERILAEGWWGIAFLVNQVHDELLYEVREDRAKEFLQLIIDVMEHVFYEIDVPVLAEGGTGTNWGEAH